jgi:hypothetical protein
VRSFLLELLALLRRFVPGRCASGRQVGHQSEDDVRGTSAAWIESAEYRDEVLRAVDPMRASVRTG